MTTAIAVIGANFGDEGKGLATDYFARRYTRSQQAPLVARCNGGAQAGHTVHSGLNRHVFGHVGSGTFAGSETYLGSNFIVNPKVFMKEIKTLISINSRPMVYAHRNCRVTTIFDMAINSLVELMRGSKAHGSCGLGINETVTRHRAGFFLTLQALKTFDMFELHDMIKKIQHTWVPARLKELRISEDSFEGEDAEKAHLYFSMFRINAALYADELKNDARLFFVEDPKYFIDPAQELIVEGAQGLMLDEYLGKFPHVTRSVTGLSSSIAAAYECGYTSVQPIYVTRAYLTRHGNGPLPNEGEAITHKPLLDYTNVPNPWQGTLRYAPLNIDELKRFIELDYIRGQASAHLTSTAIAKPLIFLTCMDQLGESVQVEVNRGLEIIPSHMLPALLKSHLKMEVPFISTGPFAQDVQFRAKVL